ncbi:MAG: hypothetical protein JXB49_01650 [Bacteroidales bacterium]|nr:hypothetical protein [Bacteroidales bacterium]
MERTKYYITVIILLIAINNLFGVYKIQIYNAYISNNMAVWKTAMDEMEKQVEKTDDFRLELVNYQYGYIAWCIGNNNEDEAKKYISLAEKNIHALESNASHASYAQSYKSAIYGYKIGLNKLLGPVIGNESIELAKRAIMSDNRNPYGYIQYGNIQYYLPSFLGGSKAEALKYYLMAEKLMEKNNTELTYDWNYLNLLTTIAKAYTDMQNLNQANAYYEKILQIEPDFLWVKNELYPELKAKLNG